MCGSGLYEGASRGGAPIQQLMQECAEDMREFVFEGREVILWQRTRDFQLVSLKMIVRLLLTHAKEEASPRASSWPWPAC